MKCILFQRLKIFLETLIFHYPSENFAKMSLLDFHQKIDNLSIIFLQKMVFPAISWSAQSYVRSVQVRGQQQLLAADQPRIIRQPGSPPALRVHREVYCHGTTFICLLFDIENFWSLKCWYVKSMIYGIFDIPWLFMVLKFKRWKNSGSIPWQIHLLRLHDAFLQEDAQ